MLRRSTIASLTVATLGLSLMSAEVSAATGGHSQASGLRVAHRHFPRHDHFLRHDHNMLAPYAAYGYLPYGGFNGADLSGYTMSDYSNYFTNPVALFSMLRMLDPAIRPAMAPTCKHSVETKTVPSEDGGERTITITRC